MSTIYVMEQGTLLKKSGERLIVYKDKQTFFERHFRDVSRILIFGNVQITTQVMKKIFYEGIDISYFSMQGYYMGQLVSNRSKNVYVRLAQITEWESKLLSLELAKITISKKLDGQLHIIKKRRRGVDQKTSLFIQVKTELKEAKIAVKHAKTPAVLRGVEGSGARSYFSIWDLLLPQEFSFEKRSKRPALNEVNSLLNFSYTLLLNEVNSVLEAYGFDVMLGYYHSIRYGRISLSLDVMEMLRPLLVDQWLFNILRSKQLNSNDFYNDDKNGVYLTEQGRKKFMILFQKWQKESMYRNNIELLISGLKKSYMEGNADGFEKASEKVLHHLL